MNSNHQFHNLKKIIKQTQFSSLTMSTFHFHTIQRSIFLLAFFLQFSSLQFPSLGYDPQDTYFINCGSDIDVNENNNLYIGESNHAYPKKLFSESNSKVTSQSPVSSPLNQTARIFLSNSSYEFKTVPSNTYMVRFHFFSFSSPTNLSSAKFTVSVPGFLLLHNFNAENTTNSPLVKEYYVKIIRKRFTITFTPQTSSFAFVNAIELFMLPLHLIPDSVARFNYIGSTGRGLTTYSGGLHSQRSLETKLRLNVGDQTVDRGTDTLSREWLADDSYVTNPQNAKNRSFDVHIPRTANDTSDGPNSNQYIAPDRVYQTGKESINGSSNISWSVPVEKNVDHLLRFHFCDVFSNRQSGLTDFLLLIYDTYVVNVNNDTSLSLQMPYYYDFVVQSDASGNLNVTVQPNVSDFVPNAFLNGLELMEVIEQSSEIPPDDMDSKVSLPVVVGSVVGGLVLVLVVVVLFLWISKIRKQRPVENSEWLPIPAARGGSSHSRLTDATAIQGSPLPNINLGLKIPLLDLQFATDNFDAKRIIGKGGFGIVYKGVLRNGVSVAVKRSEPGSGQGLPEFQTEIMVLSKIRHRHLVSLIGYCDERYEMILVYEYMEKGTLKDSLYGANLPSFLTWKQRLEICIGAARGLHYLHKGAAGGIIHRDVKSTNILLDEHLVAKVADFGLSRTGPLDQHSYVSTGVKGTFGYLDPEYFRSQQLTEKSDVYSFGVVLLEVLCARPAIEPSLPREQVNLAQWGIFCKDKGLLEDIIDPSIKGQIDPNSLRKFSEIVEKCLQDDGCDRPSMGNVLWDLEYSLQLQRGAVHREPHEDSSISASVSIQLPNVRRLPSLNTLSEVDDMSMSILRVIDESDSAGHSVFSELNLDDAR
ncbi:probable receptor-like protein kinase At2g23200 [Medicago truncatula]|uniref:probable receptor-like protein kinase At2g23200 n=1 Tax=Medicago truncatula TaxID=3880 RepID=UPI0019685631|nr:probable receptor-like protein kinase At2g23200 [Medicago truncatula]